MSTLPHAYVSLLTGLAVVAHASGALSQEAHAPRREARVVFETSPEHLAVYRTSYRSTAWASAGTRSAYGESHDFQRVCVAPCETVLPAGTDTYSVARTDGRAEHEPKPIGIITLPPGASKVRVDYRDRNALRALGSLVGLGIAVGGAVYGTLEALRYAKCEGDETCKKSHLTGLAVAGGLLVGGLTIEVVAGSISDGVDVKVTPQPTPSVQLPRARQLALRGSF